MGNESVEVWNLEGVLDELAEVSKKMHDRQFAFILGAGASFTSGIPTGQMLAQRWLAEIHRRECLEDSTMDEWLASKPLDLEGISHAEAALHYPRIFERRFRNDREAGYAALEAAMEGKQPSLGYSLLAEIIQHTRHKIVITTNFDNLVADALAMHAHQSPLVVAHESLAGFVRPQLRRPLVAKIHRDLFFSPKNDIDGASKMEEPWTLALKKVFQYFTPIVVGYGGNDGSLMGMLNGLSPGDIPGRMIWCCRTGSTLPEAAEEVMIKHKGIRTDIPGFDEFMLQLAAKLIPDFDIAELANRTAKLGEERATQYRDQADKLQSSLKGKSASNLRTSKALTPSPTKTADWWAWLLRARAEADPERKETIFKEALIQLPRSGKVAGDYARFLYRERKDFDAAVAMYKKALELDPSDANHTGNYANLLADQRKEFDAAEGMFKKALELDPTHANITGNYANFLSRYRKDFDAAEAMYKKALELDPSHANHTGNYANFLTDQRKDFDAAEAMYKKAIELDPTDVNNIANYVAVLLSKRGKPELEEVNKRVQQCSQLSKPNPSQPLAEALLYGALSNELAPSPIASDMLPHLKGLLQLGFKRGTWDFSNVFDATFPSLSEDRRTFYKAVGEAVLDATKVEGLNALPAWRDIPPKDPFSD